MDLHTPEDWYQFAKNLHELILSEMGSTSPNFLPEVYPKIIIMYEFFRLVRGESFHSIRPTGLGNFQKEIYRMEGELTEKLKELEKNLGLGNERVLFYLDSAKKPFNLNYFNHE